MAGAGEDGVGSKNRVVLLLKAPREHEEDRFVEALEHAGYMPITVPVLAFKFVNQEKLMSAMRNAQQYSGIILTSPRSVQAVKNVLANIADVEEAVDVSCLRCFVVGQATAEAATEVGFHPEGGDTGNAEKLAQFILASVTREEDRPLLFPCARARRDTLPEKLANNKITVEEIVAYETVASETIKKDLACVFSKKPIPESAVFFSPSGVQFTEESVHQKIFPLHSMSLYALGPSTQEAMVSRGYRVRGTAAKPDPASLLQLLQS